MLDAFCTIVQARPVGTGLGTKFGRKPFQTQNNNYNLYNIHIYILNEGKKVQPLSRSACGDLVKKRMWEFSQNRRFPAPGYMGTFLRPDLFGYIFEVGPAPGGRTSLPSCCKAFLVTRVRPDFKNAPPKTLGHGAQGRVKIP